MMTKKQTEPVSESAELADAVTASADNLERASATAETVAETVTNAPACLSEAVRAGADDAREAVGNLLPAVGKAIRKGVYTGFYRLSYGVVFGGLTLGRLIPSNSAMGTGLHDGLVAATRDFTTRESAAADRTTLDQGLATA